jgi:hypothetical protein
MAVALLAHLRLWWIVIDDGSLSASDDFGHDLRLNCAGFAVWFELSSMETSSSMAQ